MKISIAMATYNGARYLQAQLDSFVTQTLRPDELVVCDDGSTDSTVEILERFRERAPFAVNIHRNTENLGYVRNFEKTLSRCKGDLIFLSDQDDVWFPDKLRVMSELSARHPLVQVFICDMVLTDEALAPSLFTQLGNILRVGLTQDGYITGSGTALRRRWLEVGLPIPSALADNTGHDNWLHRLAIPMSVRWVHPVPLQYYRRHGKNASNWLASRPSGASFLTGFLEHRFADATAGWRTELGRIKWTRYRLNASCEVLRNIGLSDRMPDAITRLDRHADALQKRIALMQQPRYRRWWRTAGMWAAGDYRHFSGIKSAVKDVLR